jgi:hypothetical protein
MFCQKARMCLLWGAEGGENIGVEAGLACGPWTLLAAVGSLTFEVTRYVSTKYEKVSVASYRRGKSVQRCERGK